MTAQQLFDSGRKLLPESLGSIGIHIAGRPLDFKELLTPFSDWVQLQYPRPGYETGLWFLIGAFTCEFLIAHHSGTLVIREERVVIQRPSKDGAPNEIEPYTAAMDLVKRRGNVAQFLQDVIAGKAPDVKTPFSARFVLLVLGAGFSYVSIGTLMTGEIGSQGGRAAHITRAQEPAAFWALSIIFSAFSVVMLYFAFRGLPQIPKGKSGSHS